MHVMIHGYIACIDIIGIYMYRCNMYTHVSMQVSIYIYGQISSINAIYLCIHASIGPIDL